jgi:2-desacetyl-2-hydroxyethyl bacteriochlorophyllide A dehydrogenase
LTRSRRAVIARAREFDWRDFELPEDPAAGHVRVRTLKSLISPGTELRMFRGEPMVEQVWASFATLDRVTVAEGDPAYRVSGAETPGAPRYPVVVGYNSIGEVVAAAPDVTEPQVGDRVVAMARHGDVFDVADWQVITVPESVADEAAVFSYMASLGLHALRQAAFAAGEHVAIVGLGLVGLSAALVADACGARLVCLDIDPRRRARAQATLPDALVADPREDGFDAALERALAPHGVDVVIEAAGGPAALDLALRIVDRGGRVVVAALHPEELGPLLSSSFYAKEVAILGTGNDPFEDPRARHRRFTTQANVAYLLDLCRRGRLPLERLHSDTYPAHEIAVAYADLAGGRPDMLGVVLDWSPVPTGGPT